jgi:hypothetical protein
VLLTDNSTRLISGVFLSQWSLRACLGNGGIKWMGEDWRGFWEILTYNGNSSTPIPFVPIRSTDSQTSPKEISVTFPRGPIWCPLFNANWRRNYRDLLCFCLLCQPIALALFAHAGPSSSSVIFRGSSWWILYLIQVAGGLIFEPAQRRQGAHLVMMWREIKESWPHGAVAPSRDICTKTRSALSAAHYLTKQE